MNDLQNSSDNSERITLICSSLVVAYSRMNNLGNELKINDKAVIDMAKDLSSIYKEIPESYLIECIKRGSTGRYGKAYGINVHQIGVWWETYKQEKRKEHFEALPDEKKAKSLKEIIKNQYHG